MILHHLERSRSQRILWLLEELEMPYELKTYKRNPKTMRAPPELREVHPLGKSPLLEVDGRVLAESGAIVDAVLDRADGRMRPASGPALQEYRHWLHFAEGSLMPPLLIALITSKLSGPSVPFFLRPLTSKVGSTIDAQFTHPELTRDFRFIDDHLSDRTWFVGDELTGADVMMSFPIAAGVARAGLTRDSHPNVLAWHDRVTGRPAWQRAIDKGGPVIIGE